LQNGCPLTGNEKPFANVSDSIGNPANLLQGVRGD
jgi:hypothetical protein